MPMQATKPCTGISSKKKQKQKAEARANFRPHLVKEYVKPPVNPELCNKIKKYRPCSDVVEIAKQKEVLGCRYTWQVPYSAYDLGG